MALVSRFDPESSSSRRFEVSGSSTSALNTTGRSQGKKFQAECFRHSRTSHDQTETCSAVRTHAHSVRCGATGVSCSSLFSFFFCFFSLFQVLSKIFAVSAPLLAQWNERGLVLCQLLLSLPSSFLFARAPLLLRQPRTPRGRSSIKTDHILSFRHFSPLFFSAIGHRDKFHNQKGEGAPGPHSSEGV